MMPKLLRAIEIQQSRVRLATPYLEVESQSTVALERVIRRELAQASHTATREKRKSRDQLLSLQTTAGPPPWSQS
jgi:hypothetical protein